MRSLLLAVLAPVVLAAPAAAQPAITAPSLLTTAQRAALAEGRLVAPVDAPCVGLHVRPVAGSPYVRRAPRGRGRPVGTGFCGGPVRRVRPGWVEASVEPLRAGAPPVTGWAGVAASDLQVLPYAVTVDRGRRVAVVRAAGGRVVRRLRVGVGAAGTPTTLGATHVTARLRYAPGTVNHAAYGPDVLAIGLPASDGPAQNPTFRGRGVLALHAGAPGASSHGCVHLVPGDMAWLARHLPAGTAVTIVA